MWHPVEIKVVRPESEFTWRENSLAAGLQSLLQEISRRGHWVEMSHSVDQANAILAACGCEEILPNGQVKEER